MDLLERLEAKRREVDHWCRDNFGHVDYLWMCDLRELLDDLVRVPRVKASLHPTLFDDLMRPGHIVSRHD